MNLTIEQENIIKENWNKVSLTLIHKKYFPNINYVTLSHYIRYKMKLNHGKNLWKPEEITLIKKWYEVENGPNLLFAFIPNRTLGAIVAKAQDMGFIRKSRWTTEETDFLIKNYRFTKNKDLCKKTNKTLMQISLKKRELNLVKDKSVSIHKKYSHNEEYFSKLNICNCYVGGWIATDGCLQDKRDSISVSFIISRIDEELIDNFMSEIQYTGIKERGWKWNVSKTTKTELAGVTINCFNKCANDLLKYFNITPRKSLTLQGPNIKNDILGLSFFIGAIDGDGTITISNRKSKRKSGGYNIYPYISICGASLPFIKWCRGLIDRNFGHKFRKNSNNIQQDKKFNENLQKWSIVYKYTIEGLRATIIIDYLNQFPISKLQRKWSNPEVLSKIEEYKIKYPQYFKIIPPDYFNNYLPKN